MNHFKLLCIAVLCILAMGCGNKTPEQVVESYLKAKDWQERLKYVLDADKVKPLMEKHYSIKYERPEKFKVHPAKQIKDQWVEVDTAISGKNAFGTTVTNDYSYYLQKTSSGYKIDWEASMGQNSLTAAAFKAQRPKEPIKFRVLGTLSTNYFYVRRGVEETHWSIAIKDSNDDFMAYGYIRKDSEDGKGLYEILKDGEQHRLTLTIKWLEDSRPDDKVVVIEKFVCDGWLDK